MNYGDKQLLTLEPHTETPVRGVQVYDLCLLKHPLGLQVIIDKKESCYWVELGTGLQYTAGTWHTVNKIAYWGGRTGIPSGMHEQVGVHQGQTSRHMGDIYRRPECNRAVLRYVTSEEGQVEVRLAQMKIAKYHALKAKSASTSASLLERFISGDLI